MSNIYAMATLLSQEWWEQNANGHVWERDAKNQVVIHEASAATGGCESVHCTVCGEVFCVKCIFHIGQFADPEAPLIDSFVNDMDYAGPDKRPCRGYFLPA